MIPTKTDAVIALSVRMSGGLKQHGTALNVSWITETVMNNARAKAEAEIASYGEARAAQRSAYAAQFAADAAGAEFIHKARAVLALYHGEYFSDAWEPTGFPDQSTKTPKSLDGRQTLLRALQNYFANHAEHENPALNITAEQAGILYETLVTSRADVAESLTLTALAKQKRDLAIRDLRRRMRGSIDELELLMPDDDARWYVFGLNPPAAPDSPEPVEGVELVETGSGNVLSSWGGAPRADRYRVFKQVVGVDAIPVHVATVYDTQFMLPGFTAGQTVRVQVTAVNDAGETELSEAVEILVT